MRWGKAGGGGDWRTIFRNRFPPYAMWIKLCQAQQQQRLLSAEPSCWPQEPF